MDGFQATTTISESKEPFWNEILELPVLSLPSFATIKIECSESNNSTFSETALFEVLATDCIRFELGEEKLIATSSTHAKHATVTAEPSLLISCSLDRDLVASRQLGLWPLVKRGHMLIAAPKHTGLLAPLEPEMPLMNTMYPSATPRPAIAPIDPASAHRPPRAAATPPHSLRNDAPEETLAPGAEPWRAGDAAERRERAAPAIPAPPLDPMRPGRTSEEKEPCAGACGRACVLRGKAEQPVPADAAARCAGDAVTRRSVTAVAP
jgi:hypothetical protein